MKYTVAILACVLAVASAQFPAYNGQYNGQYNNGRYNTLGNQYNRYNPFTTPAPYRTYRPFSVTPTVTVSPTPGPIRELVKPAPVPVVLAKVVADARNADIVKYGDEINPDGSFNYFYETSNGIAAQAQGVPRDFGGNPPVAPDVFQGSFSWTSPEGLPIAISYTADENGYHPSGDAIPTPPPLPPQIARALEYTAKYIVPQKK